jgi:hypothetical protein
MDSMRRDFGGGDGRMNTKHRARVLGPTSVRLKRAAMCMCGRIQCPERESVMHLRTPGIGVRSGQREVSDTCIDEQGCQGNPPSVSARRYVEKAMT